MRKLTFKLLLACLLGLSSTNAFSQIWYESFTFEIPDDWTVHQENSIDFLYWADARVILFRQSFTFEDLMLVSPAIEIDPEGYISFDIGENGGGPPIEMAFGVVTDPADPTSFTELALYTPTPDMVTYEFDLSNLSAPDNVVYFAWKMISDDYNYFSLTNVIATGSILGVSELKYTDLDIYPNPSNGNINISSQKDIGEATVSIYDINGRTVFKQEVTLHNSINVKAENLNTGLYIMHVEGVDYSHTSKLLIN